MKALAPELFFVVIYAAAGAALLWAGASRGMGFYVLAGVCLLALAVWEVRSAFWKCRTGRTEKSGWHLTLNLAYVILALCNIARSIAEPTGFYVGLAVCWSILGVLYAVKAVRELRAAYRKKEEVEDD